MNVPDFGSSLDPIRRCVLILENPVAGGRNSHRLVEELVHALRERGLSPEVCPRRDDFSARLEQLTADLRCVVAAGGDGTLADVLNRAPGWPATVLPMGNENLLAKRFGIARSGVRVAEMIAAGVVRRFDLSRANGRVFALMASAGFDAEVVRRTTARRRGHLRRLNYLWPVYEAVREYTFPMVDVEIPETGERLRGALVIVFNLPCYALGLPLAPFARPDDGLLDLCVFPRPGVGNLLRSLSQVVRGRTQRVPGFQHRRARGVRLSSVQQVPLQTDGDAVGWLPAALEVEPLALNLIVPGPAA